MQSQLTLTQLALEMQNCSVFVIGDLLLDCYIQGSVSRLSPEAPVPVVLEGDRKYLLGGAANVAANIATLGARAVLCGRLGRDSDAGFVRELCQNLGIETHAIVESETLPTIRKTRILAGYQQLVRVDREQIAPLSSAEEQKIVLHFERYLAQNGAKVLVLSDYGKGVLTHQLCRRLIEIARSNRIPVVTDPKSNDLSRYHGTTLIKPNLKEGRELLRACEPTLSLHHFDEEVDAICETIVRQAGADAVVLSLSEHGVALKNASQPSTQRFASRALQVADVSGAGDTMVAFLALAVGVGASFARATEIANVGAALVCAKLGTATLTLSEVLQALTSDPTLRATRSPKILAPENLSALAQTLRRNGRQIVFTNGCFDLLHMGHVDLLERARALGDVLVVGLNTDESIRRLKGPERPVQTFESRSRVLAGLASVDFVIGFAENTPIELIRTLAPHILVKGGDYNIDSVVGASIVQEAGGRVEILSLVPGHSTTGLVEKARTSV
ncbi:D-glycero-beta-D-manno-heptose 1-phosphate adenylyltransferase [bacterium]|nr:D-glycero-beta-D-manno-heptose 1-phosphate adenylyltransferase [bacterium]